MTSGELLTLLGANIGKIRKLKGLTTEQLAESAQVSVGHLSDIIHGRKWVGADLLARIADVLQVPVYALFQPMEGQPAEAHVAVAQLGDDLAGKVADLIRQTVRTHLDGL